VFVAFISQLIHLQLKEPAKQIGHVLTKEEATKAKEPETIELTETPGQSP
jgi:hypothetical protein